MNNTDVLLGIGSVLLIAIILLLLHIVVCTFFNILFSYGKFDIFKRKGIWGGIKYYIKDCFKDPLIKLSL